VILANGAYASALSNILTSIGVQYFDPFSGLGIAYQGAWLRATRRALERREHIRSFYLLLGCAIRRGRSFVLRDIAKVKDLPSRGVYIFLDPDERSIHSKSVPRVVRIGTHAISQGSSSTLRARLRTHLGTAVGTGNHRGSIFRLRVGKAMISKANRRFEFPDWGSGQNAASSVRAAEAALEKEVSRYIGRMIVIPIPISDAPEKNSARAYIERNLIALFTEDSIFLDPPGEEWLGRFEPDQAVSRSGLWNVRDVGSRFDRIILNLVQVYLGASGAHAPATPPRQRR
jgi:hypothetical protein